MKQLTILAGASILAAVLSGCGPDCVALCERYRECPDSVEDGSCEELCEWREQLAEDSGCTAEQEEMWSCDDERDDVCDDESELCTAEYEAFLDCVLPYCTEHEDQCDL